MIWFSLPSDCDYAHCITYVNSWIVQSHLRIIVGVYNSSLYFWLKEIRIHRASMPDCLKAGRHWGSVYPVSVPNSCSLMWERGKGGRSVYLIVMWCITYLSSRLWWPIPSVQLIHVTYHIFSYSISLCTIQVNPIYICLK